MSNLRVIEFFSGIGGWRSALSQVTEEYDIVIAFDINPIANFVYSSTYHCQPSNVSLRGQRGKEECGEEIIVSLFHREVLKI